MAFGIPNSDGGSGNGKFLGRVQLDARVGAWTIIQRKNDGQAYYDDKSDPFFVSERDPLTFLADFRTLEVGYIKFASPPDFRVVPYGETIPSQPDEVTMPDAAGKTRRAYQPGFRLQVYSPKRMGAEPLYFSNSGKGVMGAMDELHQQFLSSPEAASGKIPAVAVSAMKKIETKTPKGTNTIYAPVFVIKSWHDRPDAFGDATVAPPQAGSSAAAPTSPAPSKSPANHAPPPAARSTVDARYNQSAMPDFGAVPVDRELVDDEVPF